MWIKVDKMGITPDHLGRVIPEKLSMWISYPQCMGITYLAYPPFKTRVDKLSTLFVDNQAFFGAAVDGMEK
jgi:hypothetical protein